MKSMQQPSRYVTDRARERVDDLLSLVGWKIDDASRRLNRLAQRVSGGTVPVSDYLHMGHLEQVQEMCGVDVLDMVRARGVSPATRSVAAWVYGALVAQPLSAEMLETLEGVFDVEWAEGVRAEASSRRLSLVEEVER